MPASKELTRLTEQAPEAVEMYRKFPGYGELKELIGDHRRTLFYLSWLANDMNATKAYMELHPNASKATAGTLGSAVLKNIEIDELLSAYGLDLSSYLLQLREGMNATKTVEVVKVSEDGKLSKEYKEVPDHKIRRPYHQALGRILKVETSNKPTETNITFNFNTLQQTIQEARKARGLEGR